MAKEFLTNLIIGGKVSPTLANAINKANQQSKVLNKIGDAGKAIGKATLAAATAAAAGVVAISKSAIDSYAEYEQLAGGSQLMFGDAYSYVAEKAATAYKDVQMSQNEYLQQVNGFATGLKTALGGNEQAAAELSHRIIKAEADVVAATGETQENIQNAFNGIMKNNFQMLDNLKLGITPTKQGFQDLITKVNQWNASNGKMTKYTIDNVADCQSALVDYIEWQGLAGYASKEASGTIQGSLAMTKAAWSNLLTGIVDENADMGMLIDAFVESASAFGDNLLPKISGILDKIPSLVKGLLPKIPPAIEELLPAVVDGANSILEGVGDALPDIIESVVSAMGQIISNTFVKMPTPMLIIASAIGAITAGIAAYNAVIAIKNVMDKIQEGGIKKLVAAQIAQNAAFLASPIFWIVAGIVALIAVIVICVKHWDKIKEVAVNAWNAICNAFSAAGQWFYNTVISPIANFFTDLWTGITTTASNVWTGICNAFSGVVGFFSGIWRTIKGVFTSIGQTIADGISGAFKATVNAVIGFAERTINGFIRGINGAIGLINKIPGVSISKIKELSIPRLATGGSFDGTRPQLAVVGDAPETMVPHGNTPRNRALLTEAAKGVGVGIGGNNVNITYAPVIHGGSGADVRQALKESETEFERKMDEYFRKRGRLSFA